MEVEKHLLEMKCVYCIFDGRVYIPLYAYIGFKLSRGSAVFSALKVLYILSYRLGIEVSTPGPVSVSSIVNLALCLERRLRPYLDWRLSESGF